MNSREVESHNRLTLAAFLVCYAAVLLLLLDHIPLWLDEILTLNVASQRDIPSFLAGVKTTQGGTPLTFLPMAAAMAVLGKTVFASRLWSAIASVAACPGIFMMARRFGVSNPLIAVIVFGLWPLQFRYAMEARPYSMALCLSIWCTWVFLQCSEALDEDAERLRVHRPGRRRCAAWYCVLVLALAHVMVYALFVPAAHVVWLVTTRSARRMPRILLVLCTAALSAACVSLVPWYLAFRGDWATASQLQHVTPVTFRAMGVVLHELTGAGYVGSILLAAGVCWGLLHGHTRPDQRAFYISCLWVPAALVPVADFVFYYFFAVRQMIFLLPSLTVLFAAGLEYRRPLGQLLLLATTVTFLYADVDWVTRPHENWNAAGAAATASLADPNACAIVIPELDGSAFLFSHPNLRARSCTDFKKTIVFAISPYDSETAYKAAQEKLMDRGYMKQSEQSFAGPRVEVYVSR